MATKREEYEERLLGACRGGESPASSAATRLARELAAILAEHHAWLAALDPVGPLATDRYDKPPQPPAPRQGTLGMWLAERCGTRIADVPTPAQVAEEGDRRINDQLAALRADREEIAALKREVERLRVLVRSQEEAVKQAQANAQAARELAELRGLAPKVGYTVQGGRLAEYERLGMLLGITGMAGDEGKGAP